MTNTPRTHAQALLELERVQALNAELLEALIELVEKSRTLPAHSEFMQGARNRADNAIAKAEGK